MSPEQTIIKKAVKRVSNRKYFWRHFVIFVAGSFLLFIISLDSWMAPACILLSLFWMRLLASHFKRAYPEVADDCKLAFHEGAEDVAIDKEIKKIEWEKTLSKEALELKKEPQRFVLKPLLNRKYEEGDLV